jgi:hypothetical protein
MTANKTFTLYLDNEKTGAKSYNIYVKNLSGNFNLTLTTGRSGKTNYVLKGGVNLTGRILVDDEGNITSQSLTATSVIESGNNQPATSDGVAGAISSEESARNTAIANAIKQSDYLYDYYAYLSEPQWIKICEFGFRNFGSVLELECYSNYTNLPNGSHCIKIAYGWTAITVEDIAKDGYSVFDKVRVCWKSNNNNRMALFVHYRLNVGNSAFFKIKGTSPEIKQSYEKLADPTTFDDYAEYSLGNDGVTVNGQSYNYFKKFYSDVHTATSSYYPSSFLIKCNGLIGVDFVLCDSAGIVTEKVSALADGSSNTVMIKDKTANVNFTYNSTREGFLIFVVFPVGYKKITNAIALSGDITTFNFV